ncbi:MAG: hypothetical protein ACFCVH_04760 [Alphaproteobacteria bacterium]
MLKTSIRSKSFAATAVIAAAVLGACVQLGPGTGGSPQPIGAPAPQPQVQRQTYNDPQVGGRWLDVCLAHGACREQQAVDKFCQQNGFQRATAHQSRVTAFLQENVRIGDQTVCLSGVGNCHRVVAVTCERTV